MDTRREFMKAGVSPFSGVASIWNSVPGYVSDYIIEEEVTGSRVRVVEGLIDSGFYLGGSFHDQETSLSRSETEEVIALLLSKMLQRNLEGLPDIWVLPHRQLERNRARATVLPSEWEPTSAPELAQQVELLSPESVALQTLRNFALLQSLAAPHRIWCRSDSGTVALVPNRHRAVFPSGLVYGVATINGASRVINQLVDAGLLQAKDAGGGRCEVLLTADGGKVVERDAPSDFELKSFVREIQESKQHPLPDLTLVTRESVLANALSLRWLEADVCHRAGSYFATSVVIGSILEGCLLARIRFARLQGHQFKKLPQEKSEEPEDWGLGFLLAVCANEGWIRPERHKFGHVLKEARNLVHPANIESIGAEIDERSVRTYWEILQGVIEDLTSSYR